MGAGSFGPRRLARACFRIRAGDATAPSSHEDLATPDVLAPLRVLLSDTRPLPSYPPRRRRAASPRLRPLRFSLSRAQAIEQTVGTNAFMHTKVNQWTSNVVEGCLKRLAGLQKPFKYVVTCNFVQKAGAGMHTASTALWDGKVDGKHTVQWENQTIQCIATVYWLAI